MDIVHTIVSILGFLIVLVVAVFFIIRRAPEAADSKSTHNMANEEVHSEKLKLPHDFVSLKNIIKNKKSSAEQLEEALALIIKYHGEIHSKLGIRAHPEFDHYMEIIIRLCRHPRANSKMIVKFDKALREKNPDYEKDINDAITKGLNSRV